MPNSKAVSAWFDDHLDLYNYAVQLGDEAWQAALSETLRQGPPPELAQRSDKQQQLIDEFKMLNMQLIALYEWANIVADESEIERIRDKVQELKKRRLEVGRLLVKEGKIASEARN